MSALGTVALGYWAGRLFFCIYLCVKLLGPDREWFPGPSGIEGNNIYKYSNAVAISGFSKLLNIILEENRRKYTET